MSTLTYTGEALASAKTDAKNASGRSFWRSFYDAIVASRERRAEREIAAYIESHGGVMNDEMERQIMLRMSGRKGLVSN